MKTTIAQIALAATLIASSAYVSTAHAGYWTHDSGHQSTKKLGKAKMKCAKKYEMDTNLWSVCMQSKGYAFYDDAVEEVAEEVAEDVTYYTPHFCYQQGQTVNSKPVDYEGMSFRIQLASNGEAHTSTNNWETAGTWKFDSTNVNNVDIYIAENETGILGVSGTTVLLGSMQSNDDYIELTFTCVEDEK